MRCSWLLACAWLAACQPSLVNYESRTHIVRPGDTLYTIAWRYGVDYRALARWNGLEDPNRIFVGQRLSLRPPRAGTSAASTPTRSSASSQSRTASLPPPIVMPAPQWQWPTRGEVVTKFGSHEGIDSGIGIAGTSGQSIVASADGRVVYAGTGLIGYGQLVIIKHNDTYLSAYGHTEHVLVTQGQQVKKGQQIAEMGYGPSRQPRLHFEIRRNGEPIDPMQFLSSARR